MVSGWAASPRPTRVHVPAPHRAITERIYTALSVAVEYGAPAAPAGRGHVTATLDRAWDFGEIHVDVIGEDTTAEIRRARRDLCETGGVEVVYLFLPLAQPGTPALCQAVEAEGFMLNVYVDDELWYATNWSVFMNTDIPAGTHDVDVRTNIHRENRFWQRSTDITTRWSFVSEEPTAMIKEDPCPCGSLIFRKRERNRAVEL